MSEAERRDYGLWKEGTMGFGQWYQWARDNVAPTPKGPRVNEHRRQRPAPYQGIPRHFPESDAPESPSPQSLPKLSTSQPTIPPMALFFLIPRFLLNHDTEPPARMTVYPCEKEPQDEVPMFYIADYHEMFLRIGFKTRIEGKCYLDYTETWTHDTWQIGVPVSFANRLIFTRSEDLARSFYRHRYDTLIYPGTFEL
ncbi:hypothetical protein DFH08DRAFT_804396 [Mycena albidolilacea]|uniref:Uncharacterized protein n=1 Tax=Mycena albidolilacea TaxID=1033008 RepID=A0AAD7EXI3_9AGAR|nr:hypothetical protein DFH08DRAFT_804396 [Mycena albidolilacea]